MTEHSTTLAMPSCPDSERELLAACVVEPGNTWNLISETDADSFTSKERRKLREIIEMLVSEHGRVSYTTLESEWTRRQLQATGLTEIALLRRCGGFQDWHFHSERVRSSKLRRDVLRRSEALQAVSSNGEPDSEVLAQLGMMGHLASSHLSRRHLVKTGAMIDPEIRSRRWAGQNGVVDIRMGGRFEGIGPGEVFVLLARSYVGKSLWASQAAINSKALSLVISLEMTAAAWRIRMVQQTLGISRGEAIDGIAYGRWKPDQRQALEDVDSRISVSDACDGTFPSMQAAIERHKAIRDAPPAFVVIDHLSYLRPSAPFRSIHEKTSESSTEVHRFARKNNLAVLLLVQVGRAEGTDGSSEVGLQSARDSGRIEEDADYLLGIWRPEMKRRLSEDQRAAIKGKIKGRMAKHRNGISFAWNFHQTPDLRIRPEEDA